MSEENLQALRVLTRFAAGLGALGGLLSIFGIYFLFAANESLSWTAVEGSVVETQVKTHRQANPANTAPTGLVEYYVSVHYAYQVSGDSYVSSRYSLGEGDRASRFYAERSSAETEATERFPEGSRLTVYYDPKTPTSAILSPGWNWGTFVPLLLGIFFSGSGWFIYSSVRAAKISSGQ